MSVLDNLGNIGGSGFSLSKYMPNFSGLGSSLLTFGAVIIILGILGFFGYMYWNNKKFVYKIEIFENLGGTRYVKTGTDMAKVMKIGNQGEETLFLKKRKKIIMAHNRKMGNNLLWFAIGQDGMWVNVTLGDLDAAQGMLDIEPVDRDMRYAHVSLRKAIENEFNKPKWMEKYGSYLMMGIFLIIIIIGIGYLVSKMASTASTINEGVKLAVQLAEQEKAILSAMDNVCSSSGIVTA